jgi:hypothetical protein
MASHSGRRLASVFRMSRHRSTRPIAVAAVALMLLTFPYSTGADPLPPLVERVKVGAYVHLADRPFRDPVAAEDLASLEGQLGGRLDVVHYFFTWGRGFGEALTSNVVGRDLMLSMKPTGDLVRRIGAGGEDAYLRGFASTARDWGRPVYLRFGHEMNGDWMEYSAGRAGGPSASEFVTAWRHMVQIFRDQKASNVKFIWSPNEKDFPNRAGNRMEDYWPGDGWIDIAGFDAYNWSDQRPVRGDGRFRTFDEIVAGPYHRIAKLTRKPIWLCEFGTTEPAKGDWFRRMFASREWAQLGAVIYFSERDDRDVQRDWRIDSSADSIAGWRQGWSRTG